MEVTDPYKNPVLAPILENLSFSGINIGQFIIVVFAFLFVDIFDTLGTLIGVSTKAGMLDQEGKLPKIKGALMADAVATTAGAVLGTSTVTTFVESASGVSEGGRTGLTAVTTAVLFGASLIAFTDFPCHSIICDSAGTDRCWILYADQCSKY